MGCTSTSFVAFSTSETYKSWNENFQIEKIGGKGNFVLYKINNEYHLFVEFDGIRNRMRNVLQSNEIDFNDFTKDDVVFTEEELLNFKQLLERNFNSTDTVTNTLFENDRHVILVQKSIKKGIFGEPVDYYKTVFIDKRIDETITQTDASGNSNVSTRKRTSTVMLGKPDDLYTVLSFVTE